MGLMFAKVFDKLFSKQEMRILMVGLDGEFRRCRPPHRTRNATRGLDALSPSSLRARWAAWNNQPVST